MAAKMFTIPSFLDADACAALIAAAFDRGFSPAPVTTARGFVMMPDLRNNTRAIIDDVALASSLWARMSERDLRAVDQSEAWEPVGLNERFRFYRYTVGQAFRWHRDGAFVRTDDERSFLTFMIYLNEGFFGGATEFEDDVVVPQTGLALLFRHGLRHQGAEVTHGEKYVLRSDVMYRKRA